MGVRVLVGTEKGGFWMRSPDRRRWEVSGPFFKGWKVTAGLRLANGRFMVATASHVYGPALHLSKGADGFPDADGSLDPDGSLDADGSPDPDTPDAQAWEQVASGPAYPDGGERRLRQVWTLEENRDVLYAGVQDAGLFASDDGGRSWGPVSGLNEHETREGWLPGAGGLCCHAVLFSASDPKRMWCGISAVGVFRTDDGGVTWVPKNRGVTTVLEDKKHKEIGRCVHGLAQDPADPDRIYRQDHSGMYRTFDGGDNWERNEDGLPSGFGFPMVIDGGGKALFAAPQESDQYRVPAGGVLQVFRSTDGGDSWRPASRGLPNHHAYGTVLRGAMAVDPLDPAGVYFGTTSGSVHVSRDLGESWTNLPVALPRILHMSAWSAL